MALNNLLFIKNILIRETIAEFIGTLILVFLVHSIHTAYANTAIDTQGNAAVMILGSSIAGGLAVFVALAGTYMVSGGHVNPAITVGVACNGLFPWSKVIPYLAAQYLGGFVASSLLYLTQYDAISFVFDVHGNDTASAYAKTAHIFASTPAPYASNFGCFIQSLLNTAIFTIGVSGIMDPKNLGARKWFHPLGFALLLVVIATASSANGPPQLNPAIDFPCRLFAWMAGWGKIVWQPLNGHYWYLTGLIAPQMGATLGFFLYNVMIGAHLPDEKPKSSANDRCESVMKAVF